MPLHVVGWPNNLTDKTNTWTQNQRFNNNILLSFGTTSGTDARLSYDGTNFLVNVASGNLNLTISGGTLSLQQATTISTTAGAITINPTTSLGLGAAPNTRYFVGFGGYGDHVFTGGAAGANTWGYVVIRPSSVAPASGTGDGFGLMVNTTLNPTGASAIGANVYLIATTKGGAGTFTNMANLYIDGAMAGGTNNYSLWIDSGLPRIDSTTANGTVATSVTSLGPTGSNTTIQEWLTININGTTRYIPCF